MKLTLKTLRTYVEFVASRVVGTGVDTAVLWVCTSLIFSSQWQQLFLAPAISFAFAVMSNFIFSYFWIWKDRISQRSAKDFWGRFVVFNLSSVAGFVIKMPFYVLFLKIIPWDSLSSIESYRFIISNLMAVTISGLFNFLMADTVVFNRKLFAFFAGILGRKKDDASAGGK